MRELETKVTDVENPISVEVDITPTKTVKVAGMEEVVVREEGGVGYELRFGICTRCGEHSAIKVNKDGTKERLKCPICKTTKIEDFRQTEKTISSSKVKDITSRKTKYKDKHGKLHDNPYADNELNEDLAAPASDKAWQRGFMCTSCRRIYSKDVKECCTDGKIISGKYSLDPSGLKRQIMGAN